MYCQSAKLFSQEKLYIEAAKSYYSAKNYPEAKVNFENAKSYNEAGETILKIIEEADKNNPNIIQNYYEEAIKNFHQARQYNRVLECCQLMKNTHKLIEFLIEYRMHINSFNEIYETNLKKYFFEIETDIMINCKNLFFIKI